MDAICLDEWELLPDQKSSLMEECGDGYGGVDGKDQLLLSTKLVMVDMNHFPAASHPAPYGCVVDEESKKPLLPPSQDVSGSVTVTEFKDIGVVQTELEPGEAMSKVTEITISDTEEEEEVVIKFPDGVKEVHQVEALAEAAAPGEDEGIKKIGFSVGNLKVHGVGALCSFGVAAATFCIFLLGGKQQHNRQNHKIELQMYTDDQRIQQVVQQASRLNQTMSSVMGGASSPRASISFGGYYGGVRLTGSKILEGSKEKNLII